MKKYFAVLSFAAVLDVDAVTLEESIISAYNNNAGWLASQAGKNAADKQYDYAKNTFSPTLDASLETIRSGTEYLYESPETRSKSSTSTQMALNLRQNLFRSFQDVNNAKSKKYEAKAAYHALKKSEQDLIINVVSAYTSVWAERQKLRAYKKKEENLKKLYDSQKDCLAAGMVTPADVAEAESKYQTAIYERVSSEKKVVSAEATFKQITGMNADEQINIPELNINLPKNLDDLKKIAMSSNQEILQTKNLEKAAKSELNSAKGKLGPTCDFIVSAGKNLEKTHYEGAALNKPKNNYKAELSVTMPILNMTSFSNIEYHQSKAKQSEFSAKDKAFEVKRNCEVYWRAYIAAEASIQSSKTAVKSAEISSESNLDQANLGTKSNTEFLDGETSLLTARIHLAESIKEKIDTVIQLFALTGNLNLVTMLSAADIKVSNVSEKEKKNISKTSAKIKKPSQKKLSKEITKKIMKKVPKNNLVNKVA